MMLPVSGASDGVVWLTYAAASIVAVVFGLAMAGFDISIKVEWKKLRGKLTVRKRP
jgi:hypothetical protein